MMDLPFTVLLIIQADMNLEVFMVMPNVGGKNLNSSPTNCV